MSWGTSSGSSCYPSQSEAVSNFCAFLRVPTDGGLMTCEEVLSEASTDTGGRLVFSWSSRVVHVDGHVSSILIDGQVLHGCETYGVDYWLPLLFPIIALFVTAWGIKLVFDLIMKSAE